MGPELTHEVAQKCCHRIISDFTIGGEDFRCESDVRLGCGHLARIAEAEDTAQALLTDRCPDSSGGCADNGGRNVVKGVLPPTARGPGRGGVSPPGGGGGV